MEKNNLKYKTKKYGIATLILVVTLLSTLIIPISAVGGNFYTGNGTFSLSYDTTNDLIQPLLDSHLVLFDQNGRMDNYYTHDVCIQDNELIANNFQIDSGSISYDPVYPWSEKDTLVYPSANGQPTFAFSRGGTNTQLITTPSVYNLTPISEAVGKSDLACLSISRQDLDYYEYGASKTGNYTLPKYYSVYAQDFYITGEILDDFVWDNGYFGFMLKEIDNDTAWLEGNYSFTIEYINMEDGAERIFTRSGTIGSLRDTNANALRLPLFTTGCVNDLLNSDTFGKANLIYVKNVYCNYDMGYNWTFEDSSKRGSYITAYSGYVACNDKDTDGSDFTDTIENVDEWNVEFSKNLIPEILANRQRYITGLAKNTHYTFTNFVGDALTGILEPKIFGTFGLGDILGICLAFSVVLAFLKFFAGG